jgi:ferrochelatase
VRSYLREFLSDPRVVELPRILWWPILHGFVLRTRPRSSAERYAQVWMSDGAPLKVHTERQARLVRGYLGERAKQLPIVADFAMRYGTPSIAEKIDELKLHHCDRLLVVPLYPQYSASTTASVIDAVTRCLAGMRNQPALRTVRSFHDHPGYIGALAQSVRDYWMRNHRPDVLVMSFHGVPRRTLDKGDPYHCECQKTGRLLAEALALRPEQYRITFQSRFGKAEWLKPYTADGPGFVADCLETLEEIAIEGKATYLKAGGREFHAIPCLNERDDWIHALTDIIVRNLLGWEHRVPPEQLAKSRLSALAMGARN